MKKELCPYCEKPLGPDGNCYNQDCEWYDPVSQYDTAEIERAAEKSKNGIYANYVINIGNSWLNLEPLDSAYTKTEAIAKAKRTGHVVKRWFIAPLMTKIIPTKLFGEIGRLPINVVITVAGVFAKFLFIKSVTVRIVIAQNLKIFMI